MPNSKTRRHSGRKYPHCKVPQKILNEEGIVLEEYWDDWEDYRDGFRDWDYLKRKLKELKKNGSS